MADSSSTKSKGSTERMILTFISNAQQQKWQVLHLSSRRLYEFPYLYEKLFALEKIEELHIKENGLTFLPPEVAKLAKLRKINISNNEFDNLPQEIGVLAKLTHFHASHNFLSKIPKDFGRLHALQVLDLSHNRIKIIPRDLQQCVNLVELNLSHNRIYSVPLELENNRNLRRLVLSYNKLGAIQVGTLAPLKALTALDLAHNSDLAALPADIATLPNLKTLNVEACDKLCAPTMEVVQKGQEAIQQWFADTDKDHLKKKIDALVLSQKERMMDDRDTEGEILARQRRMAKTQASIRKLHRSGQRKAIGPWLIGETIGEGEYAKVKLGTHVQTGEKVAIKVIQKQRIKDEKVLERVQREIIVGRMMRHCNLIRLKEVHDVDNVYFLVMEYAEGGELLEYLLKKGSQIRESEARRIFSQIVQGINYIHMCDVVHRDIKLENIMLDKDQKTIKIGDFGMCNIDHEGDLLKSSCGSPLYAAPELLSDKPYYGPSVDIWALGVILYCLVCGFFPFDDPNEAVLFQMIKNGSYPPPFGSKTVRELIKNILVVDPRKRLTLKEINFHPWFKESAVLDEQMSFSHHCVEGGHQCAGSVISVSRLVKDRIRRSKNPLALLSSDDFEQEDHISQLRQLFKKDKRDIEIFQQIARKAEKKSMLRSELKRTTSEVRGLLGHKYEKFDGAVSAVSVTPSPADSRREVERHGRKDGAPMTDPSHRHNRSTTAVPATATGALPVQRKLFSDASAASSTTNVVDSSTPSSPSSSEASIHHRSVSIKSVPEEVIIPPNSPTGNNQGPSGLAASSDPMSIPKSQKRKSTSYVTSPIHAASAPQTNSYLSMDSKPPVGSPPKGSHFAGRRVRKPEPLKLMSPSPLNPHRHVITAHEDTAGASGFEWGPNQQSGMTDDRTGPLYANTLPSPSSPPANETRTLTHHASVDRNRGSTGDGGSQLHKELLRTRIQDPNDEREKDQTGMGDRSVSLPSLKDTEKQKMYDDPKQLERERESEDSLDTSEDETLQAPTGPFHTPGPRRRRRFDIVSKGTSSAPKSPSRQKKTELSVTNKALLKNRRREEFRERTHSTTELPAAAARKTAQLHMTTPEPGFKGKTPEASPAPSPKRRTGGTPLSVVGRSHSFVGRHSSLIANEPDRKGKVKAGHPDNTGEGNDAANGDTDSEKGRNGGPNSDRPKIRFWGLFSSKQRNKAWQDKEDQKAAQRKRGGHNAAPVSSTSPHTPHKGESSRRTSGTPSPLVRSRTGERHKIK